MSEVAINIPQNYRASPATAGTAGTAPVAHGRAPSGQGRGGVAAVLEQREFLGTELAAKHFGEALKCVQNAVLAAQQLLERNAP